MREPIYLSQYDYPLPEGLIPPFPLAQRDHSRLLVCEGDQLSEHRFEQIDQLLPAGAMLVFNNTQVIRARLLFQKKSGARIEIFCLEPHQPADYERALCAQGSCRWRCMVGNAKKWKSGKLFMEQEIEGEFVRLSVERVNDEGGEQIISLSWSGEFTFGALLEKLGRIPIPPYLNRESQEVDNHRYQTVYSKLSGSVAAPTAGLHFTTQLIDRLRAQGHPMAEVTLHVGAGTFMPVKTEEVSEHVMHTEHFEVKRCDLEKLIKNCGNIVAVGTTSVRTLESLCALGYRILQQGSPCVEKTVGQWELYKIEEQYSGRMLLEVLNHHLLHHDQQSIRAATQIMIMPGFRFRVVNHMVTNFHQPKSTLLLLVSAFVGERWRAIYTYALEHEFRFLSYGDSSLLKGPQEQP